MSKPTIVCLCGSTRFKDAFTKAQLDETLAGRIVLTIGCNMKSDSEIFGHMSEAEREAVKAKLDILHLDKIRMADEVLILNVGGYIGESTARELAYARGTGKVIRFLEPVKETAPNCPRCNQPMAQTENDGRGITVWVCVSASCNPKQTSQRKALTRDEVFAIVSDAWEHRIGSSEAADRLLALSGGPVRITAAQLHNISRYLWQRYKTDWRIGEVENDLTAAFKSVGIEVEEGK